MCSPDSWRMSLSCWYCWFLSWPFKNIEWVCNSVYCRSVRGCRGHPSASVQWRQTAELPSWKGTGGGWWRTRIAGGHHGSAPPCSSPYLGLQQTPGQEGKRPSVQEHKHQLCLLGHSRLTMSPADTGRWQLCCCTTLLCYEQGYEHSR